MAANWSSPHRSIVYSHLNYLVADTGKWERHVDALILLSRLQLPLTRLLERGPIALTPEPTKWRASTG
jgi:hypothetical protein